MTQARFHLSLLLITLFVFLTNCGSPGRMHDTTGPSPVSKASSKSPHEYAQQAQEYVELAKEAALPQRQTYQVQAADNYLKAQRLPQAKEIFDQIDLSTLEASMHPLYHIVAGDLALKQQKPKVALQKVDLVRTPGNNAQALRIHQIKAQAYSMQGQSLKSAQQRMAIEPYLSGYARKANHRAIWDELSKLNPRGFKGISIPASPDPWGGWLSLAKITLKYDATPQETMMAIQRWRQDFPHHPGHEVLPASLNAKQRLQAQPRNIALLLPLSGSHKGPAQAIREGFFSAYYQGKGRHASESEIRVYDSTQSEHIVQLYQQAVENGADLVVGPLTKDAVVKLSLMPNSKMPVPVLALNHSGKIHSKPRNLFQFSLAPEGEARLVAQKAWSDGYRNATVVVPKNEWGSRVANAFKAKWQHLGGKVLHVEKIHPSQDPAPAIRRLLQIDQSHQRASQLSKVLNKKVGFQPRRRQDVEMVMLAAPPTQARRLRPLFSFFYSKDVPIYSTSSIYSGTNNPSLDRDMNGIIFCDMPWLLDKENYNAQTKQLISKHWPNQSHQYSRLFAMGVDAFHLSGQLKRLVAFPQLGYPGATGTLYLNPYRQIERQLVWAKIQGGVPKTLQ